MAEEVDDGGSVVLLVGRGFHTIWERERGFHGWKAGVRERFAGGGSERGRSWN